MGRSGISYEDVKNTAIALLGSGQKPSVQRIRDSLGTGSNSTIAEHLKRWQQELIQAPKATLPASVPESIMPALEAFWRVAVEQAESAYQKLREEAEARVATAEQARDEALADQQKTRQEVTLLTEQVTAANSTIRKVDKQLRNERERCLLAEHTIAATEQRTSGLIEAAERLRAEAQLRASKLEEALGHAREDLKQQRLEAEQRLRYERERGEANEARLMQMIDRARTESKQERQIGQQRENELLDQAVAMQDKLNGARQRNATLEERYRHLDQELIAARHMCRETETRHLKTVRLVEVLRGKLKTAVSEQRALVNELEECQKKLASQSGLDLDTATKSEKSE